MRVITYGSSRAIWSYLEISPFTLNEASWAGNLNSMRPGLNGDWTLVGAMAHLERALH